MQKLPESLLKQIEFLKDKYLDCHSCPEDKHCCCNLSHEFKIKLESYTANSIFGRGMVKEMLDKGKMVKDDDAGFFLVGKCPLLTEEKLCGVHNKKEELELRWCMEFPMYISMVNDEHFIVADKRCVSVEYNWEKLKDELDELSQKFNMKLLTT